VVSLFGRFTNGSNSHLQQASSPKCVAAWSSSYLTRWSRTNEDHRSHHLGHLGHLEYQVQCRVPYQVPTCMCVTIKEYQS